MEASREAAAGLRPGFVLEGPAFGLRSVLLESTPELLSSRVEADSTGNAGPLHRHLRSEEKFIVEQGVLEIRIGFRRSKLAKPGDEVSIPAGAPHTFKVVEGPAVFVTEFRPPWRIGEVFIDLFGLPVGENGEPKPADLAALVGRYPEDFFYAPVIPPAVQRWIAKLVARRARQRA